MPENRDKYNIEDPIDRAAMLMDSLMKHDLPEDIRRRIHQWFRSSVSQDAKLCVLEDIVNGLETNPWPDQYDERRLEELHRILGLPAAERPAGKPAAKKTNLARRRVLRVAAVVAAVIAVGIGYMLTYDTADVESLPVIAQVEITTPGLEAGSETEFEIGSEPAEEPLPVEAPPLPAAAPQQITYDVEVSAPSGKHRHAQLPDGTTVLIQGGSRLAFSTAHREARLVGEAYFEVEKGQARPFLVKTDELTVHVTGTRFNVQAWAGGRQQQVDLVDGSVDVLVDDKNIHLEPGEELIYRCGDGQLKLTSFDGNGWWNEPISFHEVTLTHILEELEIYYDVRILGKETITDTAPYTIKFDRVSTVEQMLDIMHELLEYRKDANGITVNRRETDNR